jgi:hypothetical protein
VNVLSPAAGQAGSRQGGDRANQSISTGGQRIFFDYYTLDGVNNTDPNFNSYIALPSIDAIQEFKVQMGVYPAEYGHQSTQVNVSTKSGGNAYHGALFEFLRNDAADAKPYGSRPSQQVAVQVERLRLSWTGGACQATGAQIVLHRTRRFAAGGPLDHLLVPTAEMLAGGQNCSRALCRPESNSRQHHSTTGRTISLKL